MRARRARREDGLDATTRDAALAAWARVPASSREYPRAAQLRATHSIGAGRYADAEKVLDEALASSRLDDAQRYELERTRSLLYRREGRMDDVRRVLRRSWCRSPGRTPGPADVLRELWLLDHAPMPVEAWERQALERADPRDDRVWLGRADHAILVGRFGEAAGWLDRAAARRPDDPAVWKARLALARATGELTGIREAASHLSGDALTASELRSLRAAIAGRLDRPADERRELAALVADEPGDAAAIERLAVLEFQAGDVRRSEELRRRKAQVDRAQDRVRKLLLDPDLKAHAGELAGLARDLGRTFDARAWSLVAEAGGSSPGAGRASACVDRLPHADPATGVGPLGSLRIDDRRSRHGGSRPEARGSAGPPARSGRSGDGDAAARRFARRPAIGRADGPVRRRGIVGRPALRVRQWPDSQAPLARDDVGGRRPARL